MHSKDSNGLLGGMDITIRVGKCLFLYIIKLNSSDVSQLKLVLFETLAKCAPTTSQFENGKDHKREH